MTVQDTAGAERPRQVYVRRRGRMTRGQARALRDLRGRYCTSAPAVLDPSVWPAALSGAPLGVEIGFGMGQALAAWAGARPDWRLLGIEVYEPGIGSLMLALESADLDNVRIVDADARTLFEKWLPPASVRELHIFFPDPWPKKRHAQRRIVQPDTLALFASRLEPGGDLRIATDWQPYAEWIAACGRQKLAGEAELINLAPPGSDYAPRPTERPPTRFEERGLRLGHDVWDFHYRRARPAGSSQKVGHDAVEGGLPERR